MRLLCLIAAVFAATAAVGQPKIVEPTAAPTVAPPSAVIEWVRQSAAAVGPLDRPPSAAEAAAIDRIIGDARVIGFGESNHGNREPLDYRNRLIRYLVEYRGLTAVALESGLAESHDLYRYVLGGPGDTASLVQRGLTHGFGQIAANCALIDWLRAWNRDHADRIVRLYGIDRSTILSRPPGTKADSVVLDAVAAYLARTVPAQSQALRATLARYTARFNEYDYPALTDAERREIDTALASVEALFRRHRAEMIRGSSVDDHDWASREAHDAARLPALFRTWRADGTDLPRLKRVIDLRDGAMADHVLWVLKREGPNGRVLVFQANGHVAAAPMIGSVMRNFTRQPVLTGIALRSALGERYRAIATVSSRGKRADDAASGSIDRAFASVGQAPVLLDLRSADRPRWWSTTQTASQGDARLDDLVPVRAFDGLVYFDRLTPLPPPAKP